MDTRSIPLVGIFGKHFEAWGYSIAHCSKSLHIDSHGFGRDEGGFAIGFDFLPLVFLIIQLYGRIHTLMHIICHMCEYWGTFS